MRRHVRWGRVLLTVGIALAVAVGTLSVFTNTYAKPGGGKGCICPMVYDPVICDDGKTYSNECVARCQGAKNCKRIGPGPVPL